MVHDTVEATPQAGKRARRRAERKRRIVDAALCIVRDQGHDGLSMQALAESLDYAVGALYRYFPSKDALLSAMQVRALEELEEDMELLHGALSAEEGLRPSAPLALPIAVVVAYVTLADRRPDRARLIAESLGDPRELLPDEEAARVAPHLARLLGKVATSLALAEERGLLSAGDPRTRTALIWGATNGTLQLGKLRRIAGEQVASEHLVPELLRALFLGFGANSEEIDGLYRRALAKASTILEERSS